MSAKKKKEAQLEAKRKQLEAQKAARVFKNRNSLFTQIKQVISKKENENVNDKIKVPVS